MADESDGISEAFEGQLRVAVTAAGRVGEIIARQREEAALRAQAESRQQARELASRFQAERQAARVELSGVYRNDWWDRATPEQIGATLAVARAWGNEDPEAAPAEGRMRDELRTRYGIDVDHAGGDPQAVQAAVDAELLRRQAETERQRGTDEEIEAASRGRRDQARGYCERRRQREDARRCRQRQARHRGRQGCPRRRTQRAHGSLGLEPRTACGVGSLNPPTVG